MEERRAKVLARLEARRAPKGREDNASPQVKFDSAFSSLRATVEERLATAVSAADLSAAQDSLNELRRFLTEAASEVSAHESRRSQEELVKLERELSAARTRLQPPVGAFTFRSRAKPAGAAAKAASTSERPAVAQGRADAPPPADLEGLRGGAHVLAACAGGDVLVRDVADCRVSVVESANTLHAVELTDSTLVCAPLSTSFYGERCTRCTLVVACQQLRLHACTDVTVYSHVNSSNGVVIEDCERIRLAPYALGGADVPAALARCRLDVAANCWSRATDFNWLVADKPSPNWSLLPLDERQSFVLDSQPR